MAPEGLVRSEATTEREVNLTDEPWTGVDLVPVRVVTATGVRPVHLENETVGGAGLSLPHEGPVPDGGTRSILAILFGSAVPLIIIGSFAGLLTGHGEVKDLCTALLGPVIGIVGAVVGFYFSERHRR